MRTYILTLKERKILQTYIKGDVNLDGFSVLILRLKCAKKRLKEDMYFIDETLKKSEVG